MLLWKVVVDLSHVFSAVVLKPCRIAESLDDFIYLDPLYYARFKDLHDILHLGALLRTTELNGKQVLTPVKNLCCPRNGKMLSSQRPLCS